MLARLHSYYHRINARHRAYLPVVPVCMLLATAWTSYRQSQQPVQYASTGRIVVSGRMNLPEANAYTEELGNFLGTQQEILQGEDLAARARQQVMLENPTLTGTAGVRATLLRGTSILLTQAVGENPEYTTRFLDALMEQFIESRRDRRLGTSLSAMNQIREELPRVERELTEQEEKFFRFKEQHNMGYWGRQSADSAQLLSQHKMREANLRMQLHLAEALQAADVTRESEDRLARLATFSGGEAPVTRAGSHATGQIAKLRTDLIRLQVEREQQLAIFKPQHPRIVRLDQEITRQTRLIELLALETEQLYAQAVAAMRSELMSVQNAIEDWERKNLVSTRTEAEYEKLQTGLNRTRDLHARLLTGLQSIDVGRGVNVDIVQILQRATPAQPVVASLAEAAKRGLMLGLVSGILLVLGLARIDQRAYSTAEILAAAKCETAIEVPQLSALGRPVASGAASPPELREAMRHILAGLGISSKEATAASIIFCVSSSPGEGKSTVSHHLARHAAASGLRTLLIDGDLRRGMLAETLGLDPGHLGFAEVIDGKLKHWSEGVQRLPDTDLHFIARGSSQIQTIDLLAQWLNAEHLAELKKSYQIIVIDAAPLVPVADSMQYLTLVDHVLMVTRVKISSLPLVERTVALVRQKQRQGLSLIVNGVRDLHSRYGYNYSDTYTNSYHRAADLSDRGS